MEKNKEEWLLRHALDRAQQAERYSRLCHTGFLSPAEAEFVKNGLRNAGVDFVADGGFDQAERQILLFPPFYMSADTALDEPESPLAFLHIRNTAEAALSHRDYLGALLGLGLQREVCGDISVKGEEACLVCLKDILPFLLSDFKKAGAVSLRTREIRRGEWQLPPQTGEERTGTVAAPRADAVVALAFRLSREQAKRLICGGYLTRNHLPFSRADGLLSEGDLIALRGHGRAQITRLGGKSKKGRIFVTAMVHV